MKPEKKWQENKTEYFFHLFTYSLKSQWNSPRFDRIWRYSQRKFLIYFRCIAFATQNIDRSCTWLWQISRKYFCIVNFMYQQIYWAIWNVNHRSQTKYMSMISKMVALEVKLTFCRLQVFLINISFFSQKSFWISCKTRIVCILRLILLI